MMDGPMVFFNQPLAATMLGISLLLFVYPLYRNHKDKKAAKLVG
jgi:hypothetical protein